MSKEKAIAVNKKKKKFRIFPLVNGLIFIIISIVIIVPLWKVIVDSFDTTQSLGLNMWPKEFTIGGYTAIFRSVMLYKPFLISVFTTVAGALLGLTLSTLGAYVLIQFDMPGRNFFAYMLLFTMIFQGGMIPTYIVIRDLNMLDTLWAVILPLSINVYNLVLMRNFFEGIPGSLYEAAQIDGCSPMGTFIKIVLPLSKAAIASIGLMFAVLFWNDYTNFKIYIVDNGLFNFQMRLRSMIMDGNSVDTGDVENQDTMINASIIVAILPFMILYPFCQKYFVQGVNVGAVKE